MHRLARRLSAVILLVLTALLVASGAARADITPPASTITSPSSWSTVGGSTCLITGTASDAESALILVEVSTDGGASWQSATNTGGGTAWSTWEFSWSLGTNVEGQRTIRSRAKDAENNTETPGTGVTVLVDLTPPAPVTCLTACDTPGDQGGSVTLNWSCYHPGPDFYVYRVYRSSSPITDVHLMTPIASISNQANRVYVDATAVVGTSYYYAVAPVDKAGNVNEIVFCTGPIASVDNIPPPAVTCFTAADTPGDSGGSITLDWSGYAPLEPPDIDHYDIYRETSPIVSVVGLTAIAQKTAGTFSHVDTDGIFADTGYYYAFVATDEGESCSDTVSVGPVNAYDNTPPDVTVLSLSPTTVFENSTTLSRFVWHSSDHGEYSIEVNGVKVMSGSVNAYQSPADNVTVQFGAADNFLYEGYNTIAARVTDPSGNEGYAAAPSQLYVDKIPEPPMGVYVSNAPPSSLMVEWLQTTSGDVTSYKIYRKSNLDSSFGLVGTATGITNTSYTDSDLTPGATSFEYYVTSVDAFNESSPSLVGSYDTIGQLFSIIVDYAYPSSIDKWGTMTITWHTDAQVNQYYVAVGEPPNETIIENHPTPLFGNQPVNTLVQPQSINPASLVAGANIVKIHVLKSGFWQERSVPFNYVSGLRNAAVDPSSGSRATSYTFSVEFFDPAGSAPASRWINYGKPGAANMTGQLTGPVDDVYSFTTSTLDTGSYSYSFSFTDATGRTMSLGGTGPIVSLASSSVTAAATQGSLTLGNVQTIYGAIVPAPTGGAPVNLTITPPVSATVSETVMTQADGSYSFDYMPTLEAGTWSVQASWDGNDYLDGSQSAQSQFDIVEAETALTCKPSVNSLPLGATLDISGVFTPYPHFGSDLSGLTINIYLKNPQDIESMVSVTTAADGSYVLSGCDALDMEGEWGIYAEFVPDAKYNGCFSPMVKVSVASSPGHVILVQGRQQGDEGMDQHKKTLDTVEEILTLRRGFPPENILYLNYTSAQPQLRPSQSSVSNAITNWALAEMNAEPGPLYIVFVGHGVTGKFRIYQGSGGADDASNNITPTDVDGWLDTLEAGLNGANADSQIYFIYGSCFAGSFIPDTSGPPNRVIITSAASDEESMRAPWPSEPGNPRDGEFFVNRFFNNIGKGYTVYRGFSRAVWTVENATTSQHPLEDDNFDQIGSNRLGPIPMDGGAVIDKEIGFNSNPNAPVEIFDVTPSITLASGENSPPTLLWAKVTDVGRVNTGGVWISVKGPSYTPDTSTGQVVYDMPRVNQATYNSSLQRYEWTTFLDTQSNPIDFSSPGVYEVYYYVRDDVTGEIGDFMMTRLYRALAENSAPGAFNLTSPANGSDTKTVLVLDWEPSSDADGITYTVEVSTDISFSSTNIRADGITNTFFPISSEMGLTDTTYYYWRVTATDEYGGTAVSSTWQFHTNNTNGLPGIIWGVVEDTGENPVDEADVDVGVYNTASEEAGGYYMSIPSGSYSMDVTKSGFLNYSGNAVITSGGSLEKNVEMEFNDTTDPTSSLTSPAAFANISGVSFTITGIASDDSSGVDQVEVYINDGTGWTSSGVTDTSAFNNWSSWSYTWTLPADGSYTVNCRATDAATNQETPGSGITVTVDNTPPSTALTSPAAFANISGASYTITGIASDGAGSGVEQVEVYINDGTGWTSSGVTDTSAFNNWSSWSYTWTLPSDGDYTINSRATDTVGFEESYGAGISVTVDNTPPVISSFAVDCGAEFANSSTVVLGLSVSDTNGAGNMRFSNDTSIGWGAWSNYTSVTGWNLSSGDGAKRVHVMVKDPAGNRSASSYDDITLDETPPSSLVVAPYNSETVQAMFYTVTGTADDGSGSGVELVVVSTDGGASWVSASDTSGFNNWSSWSYTWSIPAPGEYTIRSLAIDAADNPETPAAGSDATVEALGDPEINHYDWSASFTGTSGCDYCHSGTGAFPDGTFLDDGDIEFGPGFCLSCHNSAGMAHARSIYASGHGVFVSATTAGCVTPSYGNITSAETDNRPFAHLQGGDMVVCVTCHNPMGKSEDFGRVFEQTTSLNHQTYYLPNGGWAGQEHYTLRVYTSHSRWSSPPYSPTYSQDKKGYLVDPSAYAFNEYSGTITFGAAKSGLLYVFATLDYPYLRAGNGGNNLCSDCHPEKTHAPSGGGYNCLTCHTAHGTSNVGLVREEVDPPAASGPRTVVFSRYTGTNSFADGDATRDGICEVCHTQTKYYRNYTTAFANHSGDINYDGADCTSCHSHADGFAKYS